MSKTHRGLKEEVKRAEFEGGFIDSSHEAYHLLEAIGLGMTDDMSLSHRMFIVNDGIVSSRNSIGSTVKQFYINNGQLSWDNPEEYDSNKPEHYKIGIDTFERAKANLQPDHIISICKFNIDKYNWRDKNQDLEDLIKIEAYVKLWKEMLCQI